MGTFPLAKRLPWSIRSWRNPCTSPVHRNSGTGPCRSDFLAPLSEGSRAIESLPGHREPPRLLPFLFAPGSQRLGSYAPLPGPVCFPFASKVALIGLYLSFQQIVLGTVLVDLLPNQLEKLMDRVVSQSQLLAGSKGRHLQLK